MGDASKRTIRKMNAKFSQAGIQAMERQKRFIEVEGAFPLAEVSKGSKREKNIHHGHISTFHI